MTSFHKSVSTAKKDQEEKKNTAVSKLEQFLLERRGARQPVDDLQFLSGSCIAYSLRLRRK